MAFEPKYNEINFNLSVGEVKEQIKTECKADVLTESVSKILNVWAFAVITESSVDNGKIKYKGRTVFYTCYLDTDSAIKKCECGNEFSGEITSELCRDGACVDVGVSVLKTSNDLSGTKPVLSAVLEVHAKLCDNKNVNALCGGEDVIVNTSEVSLAKSLGVKKAVYPVEQEFQLNYPAKEVLYHRADAIVTGAQCGVGTIIVDGEVLLSVIILQNTEKEGIIRENKSMPFRLEIECEEAMPSMFAVASVTEKSFKTDLNVDLDNGISIMNASAMLSFKGEAFMVETHSLATDAFNLEREVELIKEDIPYYKVCDLRNCLQNVSCVAVTDALPVGVTLNAVGSERAEIISAECEQGVLKVTGVVSATGYFTDTDGKCFTKILEAPFETKIEQAVPCGAEYEFSVKAERANARIVSVTEIELNLELYFTVYPKEKCSMRYVKEVNLLKEKQVSNSAISVYLALEGEDLWSLSKRLNVCPETLESTNKDLSFPLSGKERIVIYRQK